MCHIIQFTFEKLKGIAFDGCEVSISKMWLLLTTQIGRVIHNGCYINDIARAAVSVNRIMMKEKSG